jgi:hypothetical protein
MKVMLSDRVKTVVETNRTPGGDSPSRIMVPEQAGSALEVISEEEQNDLFNYLIESIQTGGEYCGLFPHVENYLGEVLTPGQYRQLKQAYCERNLEP